MTAALAGSPGYQVSDIANDKCVAWSPHVLKLSTICSIQVSYEAQFGS